VGTKVPAWLVSFFFVAVLCGVMVVIKSVADLSGMPHDRDAETILRIFPLALLMFCVRDLGLILHVNFSSTKKNRDIAALFYLAILYLLIPLLLKIAKAQSLLPWFIPFNEANLLNAVLPITVQAGLTLYLAWKKLR